MNLLDYSVLVEDKYNLFLITNNAEEKDFLLPIINNVLYRTNKTKNRCYDQIIIFPKFMKLKDQIEIVPIINPELLVKLFLGVNEDNNYRLWQTDYP